MPLHLGQKVGRLRGLASIDDSCKTIVEIECDKNNFSISFILKSTERSRLIFTLDDKNAEFTVYAPSKSDFEHFLGWRGVDGVKVSRVQTTLLTHVDSDYVISKDDLRSIDVRSYCKWQATKKLVQFARMARGISFKRETGIPTFAGPRSFLQISRHAMELSMLLTMSFNSENRPSVERRKHMECS